MQTRNERRPTLQAQRASNDRVKLVERGISIVAYPLHLQTWHSSRFVLVSTNNKNAAKKLVARKNSLSIVCYIPKSRLLEFLNPTTDTHYILSAVETVTLSEPTIC